MYFRGESDFGPVLTGRSRALVWGESGAFPKKLHRKTVATQNACNRLSGTPKGTRTPDSAVRGLRLNRLTMRAFRSLSENALQSGYAAPRADPRRDRKRTKEFDRKKQLPPCRSSKDVKTRFSQVGEMLPDASASYRIVRSPIAEAPLGREGFLSRKINVDPNTMLTRTRS